MNSPQGDYERIIRPNEERMMRLAWRITQNADDACDAFQEAATQIWRRLARIRAHPNPQALVLRMCANAACDVVRRKTRWNQRVKSLAVTASDGIPAGTASELPLEQREQVQAAVARLPEQQATAVSMRFLLQCPYQEIAQALGCAENTARVHVNRGLNRLRILLAHLNPTINPEIES
ncbi:MAG: sigma-70 family RNA polymerase sigma factor [Planctomycetota bacterium]|nr:sigma-70 family RNA polymerase sigma factor [Planctomycetota bacterium]